MGELAKVNEIDKRKIKNRGSLLVKLQELFKNLTEKEGDRIPF
jgi:hypothetical protein